MATELRVSGCTYILSGLLVLTTALMSACSSVGAAVPAAQTGGQATAVIGEDPPTDVEAMSTELAEKALKNGTYELPDLGTVQLVDGTYEEPHGEGASQVTMAAFERAAFGDLNDDGVADAAVIVWWNDGGTGTFLHLVAVLNENGSPRQVAAEALEDRARIKALAIMGGKIAMNVVIHGPNDPLCCPSQEEIRTYELQGSVLKRSS